MKHVCGMMLCDMRRVAFCTLIAFRMAFLFINHRACRAFAEMRGALEWMAMHGMRAWYKYINFGCAHVCNAFFLAVHISGAWKCNVVVCVCATVFLFLILLNFRGTTKNFVWMKVVDCVFFLHSLGQRIEKSIHYGWLPSINHFIQTYFCASCRNSDTGSDCFGRRIHVLTSERARVTEIYRKRFISTLNALQCRAILSDSKSNPSRTKLSF